MTVDDAGGERAAGGELGDRGAAGPAARASPASTRRRRSGACPSPSTGAARAAALVSAHKLGGPKGVGALLLRAGRGAEPRLRGGGQEIGRRAGTENLVGIAGFGAAAEAAAAELAAGVWEGVAEVRNILEEALASAADMTIFVGKGARRLPNTTCVGRAGLEGRDAGDADGPRGLRRVGRVGLLQRQGARRAGCWRRWGSARRSRRARSGSRSGRRRRATRSWPSPGPGRGTTAASGRRAA